MKNDFCVDINVTDTVGGCGCLGSQTQVLSFREGNSLFWTDDVDDSLLLILHSEMFEAKELDVLLHLKHLRSGDDLADEALNSSSSIARREET